MIILVKDGVKYLILSGDANDFHNNLPTIKADIANMRSIYPNSQRWFNRPDKWTIQEQFGITTVKIYGEKVEHKEEKKLQRKEETFLMDAIPFLRVPDAHGCLLCLGDFDYNPPYELWDPYEGQGDIRENYPYAPVTYVTPSGNGITLNRKIRSVNRGKNLPSFCKGWSNLGEYNLFISYNEVKKLWGGMYHPDYPWYSGEFDNYYGMDLLYQGGLDWCDDDGNWGASSTTQVTFNGNPVGPVYAIQSIASENIVTTTGSWIEIVAYTPASNYTDKWGCIVHVLQATSFWEWYPGETFCTEDPMGAGTWVNEYSGNYAHEFAFIDSYGSNQVIDTSTNKSAIGAGLVKMHEFGERTVFTFNFYSLTTGGKFAGLAENGNVSITNIATLIDKDGNSYSQPLGQNHLGLVLFKDMTAREKIIL